MKNSLKISSLLTILATSLFATSQNVGIGITTPQSKLHINGGTGVFTGLLMTSTHTGTTSNDGLQMGIQYQADAPGNRYGYLMLMEDIPWQIGTNSIEYMSMRNNGNIGFGVTNPGFKLDLSGSMRLQGGGRRIVFRNSANDADMASIGWFTDDILSIADNDPSQSSRFYFDVENAKMGIGAIPAANDGKILVTYNSSTANPHLTLRESGLGDYGRLEFANGGAERVWHIASQNVAGAGTTNRADDVLNIWNSGYGNIMSVKGDGRVGILTTDPATGFALSVNGKIICEELKVQISGSWPDYVFGSAYKLRPLAEVENYIAQNQHLPGVPAAATVEKEGLSIGSMQTKMMEKIEELTLYLLQHQKEIAELRQLLNEQKK